MAAAGSAALRRRSLTFIGPDDGEPAAEDGGLRYRGVALPTGLPPT